jgi:transcriptional regulator with XRE-family HTH domain
MKEFIKKVIISDEKSMPKARALRLKRLRHMANLTRLEICHEGKINFNTYKGWEIGRHGGLPKDGAEKIITEVKKSGVVCTVEWLLYEKGMGPYSLQEFAADADNITVNSAAFSLQEQHQIIQQEINVFQTYYPHALVYCIEDEKMSPVYWPGDYVAGIECSAQSIHKAVNAYCIIKLINEEIFVRKVNSDQRGEILLAFNETTPDHSINVREIKSFAVIIRCYRGTQLF